MATRSKATGAQGRPCASASGAPRPPPAPAHYTCGPLWRDQICLRLAVDRHVGYCAYSTYCATNFAVRGLAEALQMEVINDNIRVSLMLPADTDTPGRAEDMKAMPEIAHKMIRSTSGFLSADEIARKALRGIKAGAFVINITREGYIASLASAGLSPQSSFLTAFAEIMLAGFMRFVGLCFLYAWYNMIDKHRTNKAKRN